MTGVRTRAKAESKSKSRSSRSRSACATTTAVEEVGRTHTGTAQVSRVEEKEVRRVLRNDGMSPRGERSRRQVANNLYYSVQMTRLMRPGRGEQGLQGEKPNP